MNNKGFGLTEMIIFIVSSLIALVICVIVYEQNFGKTIEMYNKENEVNNNSSNSNNSNNSNNSEFKIVGDNEETKKVVEKVGKTEKEKLSKTEKQYKELSDKLISTAKIYVTENYTGKTDRIIIKLSKLVEDEYMDELVDPNNKEKTCTGYVIYDGSSNYDAYLKCDGNYTSENYNVDFE